MKTPINKDIFSETGCIRQDLLVRYRDNKLSSGEKYEVEKHLVDCELCSEALEGWMLMPATASVDDVKSDLSEMVNRNSGSSALKYWAAAASVAAIVILSVFTYMQFRDARDERMAVKNDEVAVTPVQQTPENEMSDSEVSNSSAAEPPPVEMVLPKRMAKPEATDAASSSGAAPVGEFVFEGQSQATDDVKETAVADEETALKDQNSIHQTTAAAPTMAAQERTVTRDKRSLNSSRNFITYIDNLKVIDYTTETQEEEGLPKQNNTPGKYENAAKKEEAALAESKSGELMKRKISYTDLISAPIFLYNQARYESAITEFDKVLKSFPNDQNALFYKGMSLYHLKNYNQSATVLSVVSRNVASPFAEEAAFYVAKSYLGMGEKEKAKVLLQDIVKGNGFYAEQAAEELKK